MSEKHDTTHEKKLLSPEQQTYNSVRDLLVRNAESIRQALPRYITPERLMRVALTMFESNPALLKCTKISLYNAVVQCAVLGLEPGTLGHAYFVPYDNKVTLLPGYKGLMQLARNSGEVEWIRADAVRQKDDFDFAQGDNPKLYHKRSLAEDAGPIVAYYAICKLRGSGGIMFEVITYHDAEQHRDRFTKAKGAGPWRSDFDAMAMKTAMRKLAKWLPAATEDARRLQQAVALDEAAEAGLEQPLALPTLTVESATVEHASQSTAKTATLKEKLGREPETASAPPSEGPSAPPAPADEPGELDDTEAWNAFWREAMLANPDAFARAKQATGIRNLETCPKGKRAAFAATYGTERTKAQEG